MSREERAIVDAITRFLSNAPSFRCWNDLFEHAKQKLRRMDITSSETVSRYVSNIRHLITRSSLVDYNRELCILSAGCWDHVIALSFVNRSFHFSPQNFSNYKNPQETSKNNQILTNKETSVRK